MMNDLPANTPCGRCPFTLGEHIARPGDLLICPDTFGERGVGIEPAYFEEDYPR